MDGQTLVAMLGMDGAAVIWKDKSQKASISFRHLMRPQGSKAEKEISDSEISSLSGEGSRKWSAMLSATRDDVQLIVAVSQDGPVHFYFSGAVGAAVDPQKYSETANHVLHEKFTGIVSHGV